MASMWDQMVDCICRPPRDVYAIEQLAGSPAGRLMRVGAVWARRDDFELVGARPAWDAGAPHAAAGRMHGLPAAGARPHACVPMHAAVQLLPAEGHAACLSRRQVARQAAQ